MKNAIALIVKDPDEIYLDFFSVFASYDIYIIVDSDKELTKAVPARPCANVDKY